MAIGAAVDGITILSNGPRGAVVAGRPAVLSALCARLGFKNACKRGRVYLTAAKMRALGLGDAVGVDPGWRSKSAEALARYASGPVAIVETDSVTCAVLQLQAMALGGVA